MKIFNGRAATEEYMSTHSLTFSTPEMTLKKFALWLGEQVSQPGREEKNIPRLILYLEDKEKGGKKDSDFLPDIDDTFKPSGAVTEMYGGKPAFGDRDMAHPNITELNKPAESRDKFCVECGFKLKANSRFCTQCGTKQE
jgi:hypothetical protein